MSSELSMVKQLPSAQDITTVQQLEKRQSRSTESLPEDKEKVPAPASKDEDEETLFPWLKQQDGTVRSVFLVALGALVLGWWISSTVLQATRHRWIVQTFWAWFFVLVIAFRFIPTSIFSRPVEAVWMPLVQKPFFALPRIVRWAMGWLSLLSIVFGSAFGFKPTNVGMNYGDRAISVLGLFVFQFCFWVSSRNRSKIEWRTVIVGLFFQQVIALFVLKTDAGFKIFDWLAILASDVLHEGLVGAVFFFSSDVIADKWFFVNTLSVIIFFIAFLQMLYYLGVMQWVIKNFAWFFFKTMNVSGAEAVVAAASPFIGQGESACLVKPFVDYMTDSELHLTMTSVYINFGVPAQNLITASVMSIPASIAISKMRLPETDEPVTRGRVVVDRGEEKYPPANALHAFSKGAVFGLVVAGHILCNILTIISLVGMFNGLLTWIGRGFGFHHLTLQLILRYVFYPVAFFMGKYAYNLSFPLSHQSMSGGVPRAEILRVSELLATKLIENEFVAYLELRALQATPQALSTRGFTIASYALCGFANLGSLGFQIGVLSALAPSRAKAIAKLGMSAMLCGFISTMQAAGIAAFTPINVSRSFFLDGSPYYIGTEPVLSLPQVNLTQEILPFSVFTSNGTGTFGGADLSALVANWSAIDDVFNSSFLQAALIQSSGTGNMTLDGSSIAGYLSGQGTELLMLAGGVDALNVQTNFSVVELGAVNLTSGPYILARDATGAAAVYSPLLLHFDDTQSFFKSVTPLSDGSFTVVSATFDTDSSPWIGAPSRIHDLEKDKSIFPLAGVRVSVKDIYYLKGLRSSAGNRHYYTTYPPRNATGPAVQRLMQAGAHIVGTTKTVQFANGDRATADWVDYHASFVQRGDGNREPGGSSTGGGTSVSSADWLDVSIGSDTGGSIRIPAGNNGVYGIRPSVGAISLNDVVPLSVSISISYLSLQDAESCLDRTFSIRVVLWLGTLISFAHLGKRGIQDHSDRFLHFPNTSS
ncbi:hypothetical protein EWM64_g651 [Hericium alpestre]|uniref:Amidase domain-containing protein n=1 Tax=Hericium alpestre TaxID=135208 RepID=A0A4Z0A8G2_9AGAM|nr:hypothetical protein EWM64_g651 [Hericium alpestre]